jgi:hypothetical protein
VRIKITPITEPMAIPITLPEEDPCPDPGALDGFPEDVASVELVEPEFVGELVDITVGRLVKSTETALLIIGAAFPSSWEHALLTSTAYTNSMIS